MILKNFLNDIIYFILNHVVLNIPFWFLRKNIYRIFGMKICKGARINMKVHVQAPWNIVIGENSIVNEYSFLDGRGKLIIGNNVSISVYSTILTATHDVDSNSFKYIKKSVSILDNVWIGCNTTILPGCTLKEKSVLGAGSLLNTSMESSTIYAGVPAKLIRERLIDDAYVLRNVYVLK